jgi:hypothetical protein
VPFVRWIPYRRYMAEAEQRDEEGTAPERDALGSADAARQVAHLTGMTPDSARTYAAFLSGRWAHGPADKKAA